MLNSESPLYSRGVLCCLIATASWGGMFPVMTDALTRIDPFTFTSLRYLIAGVAFFLLLVVTEGREGIRLKGQRAGLAWLFGTAGFTGFGFLIFLGQQLSGSEGALTASTMLATQPMLGLLVNWLLRKVVPPAYSFLFILLSFCGVVMVVTKGDVLALMREPQNFGANALMLLGALCWVVYTVGASFFPKWSPVKYTAYSTLLGLTSVITLNGIFFITGVVPVPSTEAITSVLPHLGYMAFVAGFVGVLCWNIGNRILTPLNGVLFMDVVPLTAFAVSAMQGVVPVHSQIVGAGTTGLALICNNLYLRYRTRAAKLERERFPQATSSVATGETAA
ncbi:DMT family transporter [Telmatospirillum sp.]|uniref:DMT family transporter n=1 Tax=Telmatospirillum sp. TaxID=2079197 RepID=UPI0028411866|nr:DMT family transporter [Telmatospirillum sp.]MDR3440145.1 DMT family transporter [Telmatospirillum sp.]